MPDEPARPPVPDALRRDPAPVPAPSIDIFKDPFHPDPEPAPAPLPRDPDDPDAVEREERPSSGLAEFDAPHAFASMLASGFGRAAGLLLICIVAFGLTSACFRVSLLDDAWQAGGFVGVFKGLFHVPGSLLTAPKEWFVALGDGILQPLGVPYLLLFVGGLILAVRSEIHIIKLLLFYALLSAVHAAAYLRMKNPLSILLWLAVLVGIVWAYRWYWKQQIGIEEETESAEE